jgi:hypothetical protein
MFPSVVFKLVPYYHADALDELYDLKNYPGELTKLYRDTMTKRCARLQLRLDERMKAIRDPMVGETWQCTRQLLRGFPPLSPPAGFW